METKVELLSINNNFNDTTVVNSARVSFNKEVSHVSKRDERLVRYLVNHRHWTPLAHPHTTIRVPKRMVDYDDLITRWRLTAGLSFYNDFANDNMEITGSLWGLLNLARYLESNAILDICEGHCPVSTQAYIDACIPQQELQEYLDDYDVVHMSSPTNKKHDVLSFRITAPIYVARQLVKHKEKLVWNEISGRYVPLDIGIEIPEMIGGWTAPAENVKQGSSDEIVIPNNASLPVQKEDGTYMHVELSYESIVKLIKQWYDNNEGIISNEKRRKILPVSTYTSWIWTGTRDAFNNVVELRTGEGSQQETKVVAEYIQTALE